MNDVHEYRIPTTGDFRNDWQANVRTAHRTFSEQGWKTWACSYILGQ